ncbi:MAG: hypothetical protein ABJA93_09895 [Sporichthyaceae bacterium]
MTERPPDAGWWDGSEENRHGRHPRQDAKAVRDAARDDPGTRLLIFCHRHKPAALTGFVTRRRGDLVLVTTAAFPNGTPLARAAAVNVRCPRCPRAESVSAARLIETADRLQGRAVDLDTLVTDPKALDPLG